MKRILVIVSLLVMAGLLSACAAKSASIEAPAPMLDNRALGLDSGAVMMPEQSVEENFNAKTGDLAASATGAIVRKVLKNASLTIVVPDPAVSMDRIVKMTERRGGFVVNSNLYKITTATGIEVPYASITIRVPEGQLTEAMAEIKGEVEDPDSEVLSENISGQDVTAEYTDLQSRLINLELSEKKLQEFLDQTRKAEDWLVAFNRLSEVRGQIEVLKGQIRYYDESAAMSSISIDLQAQAAVKPITVGKWEPKGVALASIQRLIKTMRGIYEGLLKFILFTLPVILTYVIIIGLPIWFFVWLIRRLTRHIKQSEPPVVKKSGK